MRFIQAIGLVIAILASGWGYYSREISPSPAKKTGLVQERQKAAFLSIDEAPLVQLKKADPIPAIEPFKAEESGKKELFEAPKKEAFPF